MTSAGCAREYHFWVRFIPCVRTGNIIIDYFWRRPKFCCLADFRLAAFFPADFRPNRPAIIFLRIRLKFGGWGVYVLLYYTKQQNNKNIMIRARLLEGYVSECLSSSSVYGPHQCLLWQWRVATREARLSSSLPGEYFVKSGALRPQQKIIIIVITGINFYTCNSALMPKLWCIIVFIFSPSSLLIFYPGA